MRGSAARWLAGLVVAITGVGVVNVSGGLAALAPALVGVHRVARIRLGPLARFRVTGQDSEYPELAVGASGRYVIAYLNNDPFGPFGVLSGTTSATSLPVRHTVTIGSRAMLSPVSVAAAADGRVALAFSVRMAVPHSSNALFGIELAERLRGSDSRWTFRLEQAPAAGDNSTGGIAFDPRGRLLQDWSSSNGHTASLMLATQARAGGKLVARTVVRAGNPADILPLPVQVDGSANPLLAWTLTTGSARVVPAHAAASRTVVMAITADPGGRLRPAQIVRGGCQADQLEVAPSGQAVIVMTCGGNGTRGQVWVSERAPGGSFRTPMRIPGTGGRYAPSVTITADRQIWVAWDRIVGSAKTIDASIVRTEITQARIGQPFPKPRWETTPYPTQLNGPALLAGASGRLVLARGDGRGRVVLQLLAPHGGLATPLAVSPPNVRNQQVAVDAHGRGIALWDANNGSTNLPEARSFVLP